MITPTRAVSRSGAVTWKVEVRSQGRHTSTTWRDRKRALAFARLVERIGADAALSHLDDVAAERDVLTLDELAARHIGTLTGITDGTRETYRRIWARSWSPRIGHMALDLLTREAVARALLDLPGADKTIANAHGLLSSILKGAVRDGDLEVNPSAGMRLPRRTEHETEEHRYLTPAEFTRLYAALPGHWRPLVAVLAGTGCRWGEAVALQVGDVDLSIPGRPRLRILRAQKMDPTHARKPVGPPKTRMSRRTVDLGETTVAALLPLLGGRERDAPLFTADRGGAIFHRNFWGRVWRPACERAGLAEPWPRIHDLRHSHVAWLIGAGIGLPVIQARLGHEDITTTMGVYGHLLPETQLGAAAAVDAMLQLATPRVELDH